MQDIDHHMDELLRKAAANYPLRINEDGWEAIAGRLSAGPEKPPPGNGASKLGRGLFLLLWLFTGGMFISREPRGQKTAIKSPNASETGKPSTNNNARNSPLMHPTAKYSERRFTDVTYSTSKSKLPAEQTGEKILRTSQPAFDYSGTSSPGIIIPNPKPLVEQPSDPKQTQPPKRKSRFYAGIVFGPEGNQVKGQVVNMSGFDAGILAGYRINNRLSAEIGLLFSQKHYFSEGKYFNMEMPGMKIVSLHGNSTLLEIPARIKYDVLQKNSWSIFSSGGISSYLLTHEKNNYLLSVSGNMQNMISNYDQQSKYFAAAVDVSIGAEIKAGPRTSIRIQPYLQIPLKGIGVGSMPVKSMGVHAGFTRSFR